MPVPFNTPQPDLDILKSSLNEATLHAQNGRWALLGLPITWRLLTSYHDLQRSDAHGIVANQVATLAQLHALAILLQGAGEPRRNNAELAVGLITKMVGKHYTPYDQMVLQTRLAQLLRLLGERKRADQMVGCVLQSAKKLHDPIALASAYLLQARLGTGGDPRKAYLDTLNQLKSLERELTPNESLLLLCVRQGLDQHYKNTNSPIRSWWHRRKAEELMGMFRAHQLANRAGQLLGLPCVPTFWPFALFLEHPTPQR